MRFKYKLGLLVTVLLMALCLMTYQSYALWIVSLHGDEENIVNVGCFEISFEEIANNPNEEAETPVHKSINLTNTYPMNDEKGLTNTPYTFKIKNTCSINSKYHVTLNTPNTNTLENQYIKFVLYKNEIEGTNTTKPSKGKKLSEQSENKDTKDLTDTNLHFNLTDLEKSYLLDSGILKNQEEVTYNLILWMSEDAGNDQMNQKFQASVNIINAATNEGNTSQTDEQQEVFPDVIADSLDENGNGLVTQDHDDYDGENAEKFNITELRYIGPNPNNYVDIGETYSSDIYAFNNTEMGTSYGKYYSIDECESDNQDSRGSCEKIHQIGDPLYWRIIGLVNTPEGQRVKLIRKEYYNASIEWDDNKTNDWTTASLQEELNGTYFDSLNESTKNMIDTNVTWNLGGTANYESDDNGLATHWYKYERGTTVYSERPTTWKTENDKIAAVGLMYPSDYGYATSGGSSMTRKECLESSLSSWYLSSLIDFSITDCYGNDWLFREDNQWTLTMNSSDSNLVFRVDHDGYLAWSGPSFSYAAYPVIYLKKAVTIENDGVENEYPNGSEEHPFILTIEQE